MKATIELLTVINLSFKDEANVLKPNGDIGYSVWPPTMPMPLALYPNNTHIMLIVIAEPNVKKQGMRNYGTETTTRPLCQN